MRKRIPRRYQKLYDIYSIKTGSAGFVQLFKNGKRIMPKNTTIIFNLKKLKEV